MGINTRVQFYYSSAITKDNNNLDFNEGLGEINAQVSVGAKSPEQLAAAVQRALNDNSDNDYVVDFDRVTGFVTISSSVTFDLLAASGTSGFSILPTLGFTVDQTGSNSYTGTSPIMQIYRPQFLLQGWVAPEDNVEGVQPSVQESAQGEIEVVTFGQRSFMEFNLRFINDYDRNPTSIIEVNTNAVAEARAFLNFCITKSPIEIMRDRDNPDVFETILLERTRGNRDGVGFNLSEISRLQGWYETGTLVFRKIS
jgi:hypothetical protein